MTKFPIAPGAMNKSFRYRTRNKRVPVVRRQGSRNFLLFVLLFTVFAILNIVLRHNIQTMLVEIQQIEQEVQQLTEQNGLLQAELTVQTSSQFIQEQAQKKLKLVEPQTPPVVLKYSPGENSKSWFDDSIAALR